MLVDNLFPYFGKATYTIFKVINRLKARITKTRKTLRLIKLLIMLALIIVTIVANLLVSQARLSQPWIS